MQERIQGLLKEYWGYDNFRPLQEKVIHSVLQGNDTLALMPTGGGKSLCFQVTAMARDGICLVITPLIALMKDQVQNLQKKGITAVAIHAGLGYREIDILLDNCVFGRYKFLYISPERLETSMFRERLPRMNVNLLAVDEAHCISQWGYDFRPSYLKIANIREIIPDVPVLALTATATPDVVLDIQKHLDFKSGKVFEMSFDRPNLIYGVVNEENKRGKLLEMLRKVPGTAIVYVRNRRATREVSTYLQLNQISADHYHAGLNMNERMRKQEAWSSGKTRVMISTNAFGMGIDKGDVRTVVHLDLPDSLEAYYQEAGRAGRDGMKSYALIIVNKSDELALREKLVSHFPEIEDMKKVYHAIGSYLQIPYGSGHNVSYDFNLKEFSSRYEFHPFMVYNVLKHLEHEGYFYLTESTYIPSRIKMVMFYKDLYQFQVEHPADDPVIKILLRSHGGIFDQHVTINEQQIARKMGRSVQKIREHLQRLHRLEICDYMPSKETPQITFLHARMDAANLYLDPGHLRSRKRIFEKKIRSVLGYAFEKYGCRSQYLLKYFGETMDDPCGHCDHCLGSNRKEPTPEEFDTIKKTLYKMISEKPVGLMQLKSSIPHHKSKHVMYVVRWLIDQGSITMKEHTISLNK